MLKRNHQPGRSWLRAPSLVLTLMVVGLVAGSCAGADPTVTELVEASPSDVDSTDDGSANSDSADSTVEDADPTVEDADPTVEDADPTVEDAGSAESNKIASASDAAEEAAEALDDLGDSGPAITDGYDAPGDLLVPVPLPQGAPGTIIQSEDLYAGVGKRFLYHSTSAEGTDIAVSGFARLPEGEAPAGGWPLVAWAHGTTGVGDQCAPSHFAEFDTLSGALNGHGYAVVATDYEGLGTPGLHPYIVGTSEGQSVLDSVRAVQELELPVTERFVAFGHSQGGHAALFTAQLQPTYAPELELLGTIAGAPASQMRVLTDVLIGSPFQGYLVMVAAGIDAAYSDLSLDQVLTPEALSLIDVTETGCTSEIFAAYNDLDYSQVSAVDDPLTDPVWGPAIEAQDPNKLPVVEPLLIIHGGNDEQIPVETSETLVTQLCALEGQGPIERIVYPDESHAGVLTNLTAEPDLLRFLEARFSGSQAVSQCP